MDDATRQRQYGPRPRIHQYSTSIEESWKSRVGHAIHPYDKGLYGVWNDGEPVARTETPEEAVALMVAAFPRGLGPAS